MFLELKLLFLVMLSGNVYSFSSYLFIFYNIGFQMEVSSTNSDYRLDIVSQDQISSNGEVEVSYKG